MAELFSQTFHILGQIYKPLFLLNSQHFTFLIVSFSLLLLFKKYKKYKNYHKSSKFEIKILLLSPTICTFVWLLFFGTKKAGIVGKAEEILFSLQKTETPINFPPIGFHGIFGFLFERRKTVNFYYFSHRHKTNFHSSSFALFFALTPILMMNLVSRHTFGVDFYFPYFIVSPMKFLQALFT